MKTVAGIDLGTQSMKVVLFDYENSTIVDSSSCPMELISENDGSREQKTEWYDKGLDVCFSKFSDELKKSIQAIGVSGQQHGFVPLDKDGKALYNIKLWNDTSTTDECALLTEAVGGNDKACEEVSNFFLTGFTAPKIYWLKRNKPELFDKLAYVMLPHDYLNFVLTGSYCMESGDASGTALFNTKTRTWSKKVCDIIDPRLIEIMPKIIRDDEPCGFVTKEAAARFSIPEGIPVSAGGGDNMMGAIGTGTCKSGTLTMSMGTSGTLYGFSDTSIADPAGGISGFCSSTEGYLPLLCTMNCTVASEFIRNLFNFSVKELDAEAAKAPIGAEGVFLLPFFNGERTPNLPHGKASITGMTTANTNRANIARAALESAVFSMRTGLDTFRKHGFTPKELSLIGGGAKSPLWRQIVADIMNLPVRVPECSEAAAFGAALQALWCMKKAAGENVTMGDITDKFVKMDESKKTVPVPENVAAYEKVFAEYEKVVNQLAPLYV